MTVAGEEARKEGQGGAAAVEEMIEMSFHTIPV